MFDLHSIGCLITWYGLCAIVWQVS